MDSSRKDDEAQHGRVRAITTFSPVRRQGRLKRALWLSRTLPGAGRPLQDLAFIHFAHWSVIHELGPRGDREPLHSPYLLFESNYDGGRADYLEAFADRLPLRIEKIWRCCWEFDEIVQPHEQPDGRRFKPEAFKRYVAKNRLDVVHFYCAYPDATTRTMRQAVRLSRLTGRAGDDALAAELALTPDPPPGARLGRRFDDLRSWRRTAIRRYWKPGPMIVATPIDPSRRLESVACSLAAISGDASPLGKLDATHVARFVLLPRALQDAGQQAPDTLRSAYLLFSAVHDGSAEEYREALAGLDPAVRRTLWGACRGFAEEPGAFAGWLERHSLEPRYFVAGVDPARTAKQLRDAFSKRTLLAGRAPANRAVQDGESAPAPSDVQGNVLHAYGIGFPAASHALLRVVDGRAADARAVVRGWSERLTFEAEEPRLEDSRRGRAHLNLAFTYAGLVALGAREDDLADMPDEFKQGAAARAPVLGDRAESAVEHWEFGREPAHVLLSVHAGAAELAREWRDRLVDLQHAPGGAPLVVVHAQDTELLGRSGQLPSELTCGDVYAREHFGFADGCSQPGISEVHSPEELSVPGSGVHATRPPGNTATGLLEAWRIRRPRREWRGVALGEFVLGHRDEDLLDDPPPRSALASGGSFMVYRKLAQDVQGFLDHIQRASPRQLDNDAVRARIVGRWQDGTPLARSPDRPDPAIAADRREANRFGYSDDPTGRRCPLGAHIRRTNPRDGLPAGGEATMRHRIIRRGMPYGPSFAAGTEHEPRGLLFICYSASIARGFETIQSTWCDDGGPLGLGADPDYLLQQRPGPGLPLQGRMVLDVDRRLSIEPPPRPFVTTKGTEYLLLPGRSGLSRLLGA